MKSDERITRLPQPIIDRLREVIAKVRRVQWVRGSLITTATATGGLLAVMAADAAFSLEWMPLRLAASLSALGLTGWTAWTYWLRPLSRRISLTSVALWLESRHPELQERISTAVELMDDRHGPPDEGSRELLEEVVRAAVADAATLDPAQHLGPQRSRVAKRWALAAAGVLVAVLAVWPHQAPLLLARALAPMADVGNAWADRIRVITQSQVLAKGDPLAIEVAVSGKTERVELRMTDAIGRTLVETLMPDAAVKTEEGETGYALRLPAVNEGFTARVVCGKAVSAGFTVTVMERPETGNMTLTYHFPDYMKRADEVKPGASGEIAAFAGTAVSVSAPLNRAVEKAEIFIGETAVPEVKVTGGPEHPVLNWTTVLPVGLETEWHASLTDSNGITNRAVKLPIRALQDRAPLVVLESPADSEMELRPSEKLPMAYTATEDVGFSAVKLRIRVQGKADVFLPVEALPERVAEAGMEDSWRGGAVLDLKQVPVPDGQEFRVAVVVEDNLPPDLKGPQMGESREILVRMRRGARSLTEQVFAAQHQELKERMNQVRNELQDAKGRLNDKPDRLRHDDKMSDNVLKDLESTAAHLDKAQKQMEALTERMKNTAFAKQTPDLAQIAQQMMKPASNNTKEIPLTDKQETRANLAQTAKDQLEQALQKLEEQQQELDKKKEDVKKLAQLADIAEQQKELAREAEASGIADQADRSDQTDPGKPGTPESGAADQPKVTQASGQQPPAAPAGPTPEEQRKWLEAQRKVAERAKQLMDENRNRNPEGRQEELRKSGAQAAELAATAKSLAKKQSEIEAKIAAAGTAQAQAEAAAAQQALLAEAKALEEKTFEFQIQSSHQIEQSAGSQEAAYQVQNSLGEAVKQAKASGEELARAVAEAAKPQTGDPAAGEPTHSENKTAGAENDGQAAANAAQAGNAAARTAGAAASADQTDRAAASGAGDTKPAAAAETVTAAVDGDEASSKTAPAAPGQSAATASKLALEAASSSFDALDLQLQVLAGVIGAHGESLNEGTKQAGQAAEQAGQRQQQGQQPSMRQGAGAARLAAEKLTAAAATAMQAAGVPKNANTPQTAGQRSEAKGANGRPNESGQPGRDGGDILQADTANGGLPPELAKLGLSPGDWAKLKGVLGGVDSAASDQVPPEYRELVKAYFGALAKGGGKAK
ncbi:MAG: hypothetical protein V4726_17210 [Verrucomicrobiota bacterium]